ncbi:IclR family transcriptional regulator C-terminal domain-containing protein [Saccharopolyspora sp. NPDC000359]|uniref:IclR family transcriptional regulator domain-containing protein n=1 Tax=Saccharopolyspora sp. NPDC000359 TaxID=3154251 RepID=UPI0033344DA6
MALGKLLTEPTREEVTELLPALTENTVVPLEQLHQACATARERRCASEVEEGAPGIRCVAAVVPYRMPCTDAISRSVPVERTTGAKTRRTGELLSEVTAELAQRPRREGIRDPATAMADYRQTPSRRASSIGFVR